MRWVSCRWRQFVNDNGSLFLKAWSEVGVLPPTAIFHQQLTHLCFFNLLNLLHSVRENENELLTQS